MVRERELLSQKYGKAGLSFEPGAGASILKGIFGHFLGDASFLTDVIVDGLVEDSFLKTIKEEGQTVQGDVWDIANKFIGMLRIRLTNKNFYLFYKKGFRSKQKKLLVLPLKHAKDVRIEGVIFKELHISFEVPQKEKESSILFDLVLRVFFPYIWMSAINSAISETLLDTTEEKVFGCITVFKRVRHGLFFTKNRVIVAKTDVSSKWLALVILLSCSSVLYLIFSLSLVLFNTFGVVTTMFITVGPTCLILIGPYIVHVIAGNRKHKKLSKSAPNDILSTDKKNFEIPYSDIDKVELKKGGIVRNKIKIWTNSENYDFYIVNKKLLYYHISLLRWVLPESKLTLPKLKEPKIPKTML